MARIGTTGTDGVYCTEGNKATIIEDSFDSKDRFTQHPWAVSVLVVHMIERQNHLTVGKALDSLWRRIVTKSPEERLPNVSINRGT